MNNRIVLYPYVSLKTTSSPLAFEEVVDPKFPALINRMFEVMYSDGGIGLSAPQIGVNKRVLVGNPTGRPEHISQSFVMINPSIVPVGGEQIADEGCLSLPGIYIPIRRYDHIQVTYLKPNGKMAVKDFDGLMSRIIQHETDHLDGIMMMDRLDRSIVSDDKLQEFDILLAEHIARTQKMRRKRKQALKKAEKERAKVDKSRAKSRRRKAKKRRNKK